MKKKNKLYSARIYASCGIILIIGIYMLIVDPSYVVGSIISILSIIVMTSFFLYSKNTECKRGIKIGESYRIIKIYPNEKIAIVVSQNGNNFDLFALSFNYFTIDPDDSMVERQFMAFLNRKNLIKLVSI